MPSQKEYNFSIPRQLVEDIAEEIATRATTRLLRQITPQSPAPSQPAQSSAINVTGGYRLASRSHLAMTVVFMDRLGVNQVSSWLKAKTSK